MITLDGCETFMWGSLYILAGSASLLASAMCLFGVYMFLYGAAELRSFAKETFKDCSG